MDVGDKVEQGGRGTVVRYERYYLSALLGMACSIDKVIIDRAKVSPFI